MTAWLRSYTDFGIRVDAHRRMIRPRNRHRRPLPAFENGTLPKAWLDEVFEGRPAFFLDSSAHSGWVSGRALQIAGEIVYRRD